jgi:hypothetical protein
VDGRIEGIEVSKTVDVTTRSHVSAMTEPAVVKIPSLTERVSRD